MTSVEISNDDRLMIVHSNSFGHDYNRDDHLQCGVLLEVVRAVQNASKITSTTIATVATIPFTFSKCFFAFFIEILNLFLCILGIEFRINNVIEPTRLRRWQREVSWKGYMQLELYSSGMPNFK